MAMPIKNDADSLIKYHLAQRLSGRKRRLPRTPRILYPSSIERQYQRQLKTFVRGVSGAIDKIMLSQLESLVAQVDLTRPRQDAFDPAESVAELAESTRFNLSGPATRAQIEQLALTAGIATADFNKRQLLRLFRTVIGVDLIAAEPYLEQELRNFTKENVALIRRVQEDFIADSERIVFDGFRRGLRSNQIRDQIIGITKGNKQFAPTEAKMINRATLIARDQISKLHGNLNEMRQQSVGVESYIWRDSRDGRVRDDHKLDGELFTWRGSLSKNGRSKPKGGLNPSEDIACRCWAEPYFGDLI